MDALRGARLSPAVTIIYHNMAILLLLRDSKYHFGATYSTVCWLNQPNQVDELASACTAVTVLCSSSSPAGGIMLHSMGKVLARSSTRIVIIMSCDGCDILLDDVRINIPF